MNRPILSEKQIENKANEILEIYSSMTGKEISLPVPIEKIAHQVLDLAVEWEPIPAIPGRDVLSKFAFPEFGSPARIVMNLDHVDSKFRDTPGLEITVIAHEVGHGVFHNEPGRQYQLPLGLDSDGCFVSEADDFTDKLTQLLGRIGPTGEDWWREWQAHTFMRFVLMPRNLLEPLLSGNRHLSWGGLYDIRERCGVTISALRVHLEKLKVIQIENGTIHPPASSQGGSRLV